jgi:hypothetical protein
MSPDAAINECRRAFADGAPAWPAGLIRFLDNPPDVRRVFAWVVGCTRRLLLLLGEDSPVLENQMVLLESYVRDGAAVPIIRETLELLWVQRSPHETAKTAVLKVFAALICYRVGDPYRHLSCTASITMLVSEASNPEEALALVLQDFARFVG